MFLLYVILAVLFVILIRMVIIVQASKLYEDWALYDAAEQDQLWHIIRQANKRRKKIERLLARERQRTEIWVRQPRYGRMAEQIRQLEARNRELAATIVESIVDEQPAADVLVDRLRRKGP